MPTPEPPVTHADPQKLAPNSQESEEAVLGSILINEEILPEVREFLRDGTPFYFMHHRMVYAAICAVYDRGDGVNVLTVVEELRARRDRDGQSHLDKMGGSAFITHLINNTPTHIHYETYARMVERLWVRRALLDAASSIAKNALDDKLELEDVLAAANQAMASVETGDTEDGLRTLSEALDSRVRHLIDLSDGRVENRVISTGFSELNRRLADGGFAPGTVHYVAGRPGMGKSSLLIAFALTCVRAGFETLLCTLEMSEWQIVDRVLSAVSKIETNKIKQADMNDDEWQRLKEAKELVAKWPLIIKDKPGQTLTKIKAAARRRAKRGKLRMLVVDYLQIMGTGDVKTGNRTQDLGAITRGLKELAKELNIPILVAVQLRRLAAGHTPTRPSLEDMREADDIANDADAVYAVWRESYYIQEADKMIKSDTTVMEPMEIIGLKMRDGDPGIVPALWNGPTAQVLPAARETRDVSRYMKEGIVLINGNEVTFRGNDEQH